MVSAPSLPEDVAFAAVLIEEDGAITLVSDLVPRELGQLLELDLPRAIRGTVRAHGWSAASLGPVLPADLSALEGAALAPAAGSEQRLPPPMWIATGDLGSTPTILDRDEDPSGAIELTAAWLPPCGRLAPAGSEQTLLMASCAHFPDGCVPYLEQSGCEVKLTLSPQCGVAGEASGTLGADGSLQLAPRPGVDGPRCERVPADEESELSLLCRKDVDCRMDVYSRPFPSRFRTRTVRLRPSTETTTISAMASLGDRIAVALRTNATSIGCAQGLHRFEVIDASTFEVTATATAPPCVSAMDGEPGGGFLAAWQERGVNRLGRFDRAARRIFDRSMEGPAVGARQTATRIVQGAQWIAVGYRETHTLAPGREGDAVVFLDREGSRVLGVRELRPGSLENMALIDQSKLVLIDDKSDSVRVISPTPDGGPFPEESFSMTTPRANNFTSVHQHALTRRIVVAGHGASPRGPVLVSDDRWNFTPNSVVSPLSGRSLLVSTWPADPRRIAVAIINFEGPEEEIVWAKETVLALVDPDAPHPRFMTGEVVIGPGPPGAMVTDSTGGLWISLKRPAYLVRVDAD